MRRFELEHIIRASSAITGDKEIVVIGSQAILGHFSNPEPEFVVSVEADVFPRNMPELADLIDGSIGEGSLFQSNFGYYAHGVSPSTAILPINWESRLVILEDENTGGARGLCLEIHDLALSKYAAGREKDLAYNNSLAKRGIVIQDILFRRLESMPVAPESREIIRARIARDFSS